MSSDSYKMFHVKQRERQDKVNVLTKSKKRGKNFQAVPEQKEARFSKRNIKARL